MREGIGANKLAIVDGAERSIDEEAQSEDHGDANVLERFNKVLVGDDLPGNNRIMEVEIERKTKIIQRISFHNMSFTTFTSTPASPLIILFVVTAA